MTTLGQPDPWRPRRAPRRPLKLAAGPSENASWWKLVVAAAGIKPQAKPTIVVQPRRATTPRTIAPPAAKPPHSDTVERELKPRRWVVDSFINLPEMAVPGIHALETRFESPKDRFSFQADFPVEDGRTLLSLPRS